MSTAAPRGPISSAGIFLIVVGALMAVPSGACTGILGYMLLTEGSSADEALSTIGLILLYAGLPLFGGIALIVAGLRFRKPPG